jgi:hypothetical protein
MTDDVKVDSREVMSIEEMERIYKDVPGWRVYDRSQIRAVLDAALSRYAAKMGTGGRRVEGCADENGRFLYSPHLKCSDSSHRPARLIITEPVVEMTLMAAVDKILRLWRKASDPIETPEMRMLSEAAAREHAKVGK